MKDKIFIYPTDTVWGIGGNIHVSGMLQQVNRIKGYSENKPLSILFSNLAMLSDYFDLALFDKDWLQQFFKLEATLGLPVSWLKKSIPEEVYGESSFICVRVLSSSEIDSAIAQAEGPVFTTSFNLKGEAPALTLNRAKQLAKKICPKAVLIKGNMELNGDSSTILWIDESLNFTLLRAGTMVDKIEKHIKLLTA